MSTFSTFFTQNQEFILFAYGLAFFVLGFAIILQTRQSTRLELSRNLRWLAGFGILHAFNEWGDLFIPLQSSYLNPSAIRILHGFHLVVLGSSFACLFKFGISVLRPKGKAKWLHILPAFLLLIWLWQVFFVIPLIETDLELWYRTSNALARYFIGFPGGLVTAFGLREHAKLRIEPLKAPTIYNNLRIAGLAMGLYALISGLIPPPVEFFPGNFINSLTFQHYFGFPVFVLRSFVSVIIAISFIRALEIFQLETERRIELLEQQLIINEEHERLSRELHDGAIQKVYTAGLLVESATRLADPESELGLRMGRAVSVLKDALADLRHNLVELHSNSQTGDEKLLKLIHQLAADPHYNSLVTIHFENKIIEERELTPSRIGHAFAIVNEALANIVRHAKAQNIFLLAEEQGDQVMITIMDDGIGFSVDGQRGYGLRNIRDRARLLNGKVAINSTLGKGTSVRLEFPWQDSL